MLFLANCQRKIFLPNPAIDAINLLSAPAGRVLNMASDQFGNYQPGLKDNVDYVTPQPGTPVQIGSGAPTSNTSISPVYLDSNSDNIWVNPSLTENGWVLSSGGGGGGSVQVMSGSASNPNTASIVPDNPTLGAIYYQDSATTPYNFWTWSTTARSWSQVISPS